MAAVERKRILTATICFYLISTISNSILTLLLLLSFTIDICYILWWLLLLLVGPGIIFLLLPRIDIISHTSIITLKLFHKKVVNLPKLFSAPLVPCPHLPWYLCMLFVSTWSAFLCLMQCLASLIVYPKLCQRSNQLCRSTFWQTSIDFDRKSSISQVGCCCERRWNYRPRFSETWMFC